MMTGQKAGEILFNCATILTMHGANEYRIGAYRNAARIMIGLGDDAGRVVMNDELLKKTGFGNSLARKLRELFATGAMGFYDGLLASLPEDIVRLMKMPGVGPTLALRLFTELGVRSPRELQEAARQGKVSQLYGFGPKREARWAAHTMPKVQKSNITQLRPVQPTVVQPELDFMLPEAA